MAKCMLCGKPAEKGDVCAKCIKDYDIKEGASESVADMYKPIDHINRGGMLDAYATIILVVSIISIILGLILSQGAIEMKLIWGLFAVIIALFCTFLLKCMANALESIEIIRKQLEEINKNIKNK